MKELYGRAVPLEDMLAARDARAARQKAWLDRYRVPLLCLTLNVAGPIKVTEWIHKGFEEAVRLTQAQLHRHAVPVRAFLRTEAFTGLEAMWAADSDAPALKRMLCRIEAHGRFGRLLDLDVIGTDGDKISREDIGLAPRRCLLCGGEAAACARSRAHSVAELFGETEQILRAYFEDAYADRVAGLCVRALLYEVAVTPKPGLVDRHNSGAHKDMHFFTFLDSASTLWPYFRACVQTGLRAKRPDGAFDALRYPGMLAEDEMLRATGGINAHKGAIFSLGILAGALGLRWAQGLPFDAEAVCALGAEMTQKALLGEIAAKEGPGGARAEAASGFPSALRVGLPALKRALGEGLSLDEAGAYALCALMGAVEDANVLRRGGAARAAALRDAAQTLLAGFSLARMREMDAELIAAGLSPGGCADLLAVSFLLWFLEKEERER